VADTSSEAALRGSYVAPWVKENESVSLTLSKPSSGAVLGTQKKATLTIIGNDYGKEAGRAADLLKRPDSRRRS